MTVNRQRVHESSTAQDIIHITIVTACNYGKIVTIRTCTITRGFKHDLYNKERTHAYKKQRRQNMKVSKYRQHCNHHEKHHQPETDFMCYGRILGVLTRFAEADAARGELRRGDQG